MDEGSPLLGVQCDGLCGSKYSTELDCDSGCVAFAGFRYVPSQADVVVFDAISSPPPADMIHALRWFNHIKSFQKSR